MKLTLLGEENSPFLRGIRSKVIKAGHEAEITQKYSGGYYVADWETYAGYMPPNEFNLEEPIPAVTSAIFWFLNKENALSGKNITIIGRGNAVSLLPNWCLAHDATVTVCHTKTRNLNDMIRHADAVVIAAPMLYTQLDLYGKLVINIGNTPINEFRCLKYYSPFVVGRRTTQIIADRFEEAIK